MLGRSAKVVALQQLALQMSRDGRFDEALVTVQEARAVAARLRFGMAAYAEADLVHTRAHVLYDAGRWEEAASDAGVAVDLRRHLGGELDSDQLSRLSDSLEVRANALTRLRRLEEADALSAEVVQMRARLPWGERARALLNRSATLLEAGRHEEGLAAAQEIVRLASARPGGPDLGDPALVDGLVNLAVHLRLNGQWSAAVAVQGTAVDQLRAAASTGPASASADLASALSNQSLMNLERGHLEEAVVPGQEALEIRERLAGRSANHLAELTDSLNNEAALLLRIGRNDEAELLAARCVELRRRLHERHPAAFERQLANALATHCHALAASGRPEPGVVAGREAVDRFRALDAVDPHATGPWLTSALDSLAGAEAGAGLDAECLASSRAAVAVGARVTALNRPGFGGTYAETLLECAERCRRLPGVVPGECLAWVREAVDLLAELAGPEPEAYDVLLTRARAALAGWEPGLGGRSPDIR